MKEPRTPAEFARHVSVSRETLERLTLYGELLGKWQKTLNLVSDKSMTRLWCRHMLDSAQLFRLLPNTARNLLDLGSGAGFPGLVLAVMGAPEVHLVESDQRKCAFLREVARATGTSVTVHPEQIEGLEPWPADVITARALAPLPELLNIAYPFVAPSTCCIFMKGARIEDELEAAKRRWRMKIARLPSLTDDRGVILQLEEVHYDGAGS